MRQNPLVCGVAHIIREGEYEETSPPAIIEDLVVVGSSIADNDRVDSPDGTVRAFDARAGTLRWHWEPIPTSLAPTGAGNSWSMISVDAALDLVFVPTGALAPTTMARNALVMISGRIPWLRFGVRMAASYGGSKWSVMTFGLRHSAATGVSKLAPERIKHTGGNTRQQDRQPFCSSPRNWCSSL